MRAQPPSRAVDSLRATVVFPDPVPPATPMMSGRLRGVPDIGRRYYVHLGPATAAQMAALVRNFLIPGTSEAMKWLFPARVTRLTL